MDEETLYISDCDGLLQTEIVGRFLRLPDETGRIVSYFSNNQSDSSDIEDLIACCGYTQITPYHNNQADFCIIPIWGEQSHREALDYAKARLEEQWDSTAHDETIVSKVEMKIIHMHGSEIEDATEDI